MSKPVSESKPAGAPEPAEDPWHVAFVEFKARDEKMVKEYQEEIDTLLVFVRDPHRLFILKLITLASQAGLLSAVLTAFVVESYQSLQEDYTHTSVDLLRHISHQLANSSLPAAPHSIHFHAQPSDVRVNVCWFVSLLLSLFVALFGIFLKQWMRAYIKWTDVRPDREAVALRHFRHRGLKSWHLGTILTLLPTLLQLAVILFLGGLLEFLWNLDRIVADVMGVLSMTVFFLVATVTVLPVVSRSCPYRSPLSEGLALPLWRMAGYIKIAVSAARAFIHSGWTYSPKAWPWMEHAMQCRKWHKTLLPMSWVQADEGAIARCNSRKDHVGMHISAMVHLCCTTQSQPLRTLAITGIITEYPPDSVMNTVTLKTGLIYCDEVWWPILRHVMLFHKKELGARSGDGIGSLHLFWRITSEFRRFSVSMKQCWLDFLLHSKSLVCGSHSNHVVESYLLCCIVGLESTTDGQCMLAFMEVLKAQSLRLEERQLDRISRWLYIRANIGLGSTVLYQGDPHSGLSSLGASIPRAKHPRQVPCLFSMCKIFVEPYLLYPTSLGFKGACSSLTL
jgi:hypothetical protein